MSVAQQPIPGFPHLTMPVGYNNVADYISVLKLNSLSALQLSKSARTQAQRTLYSNAYDRNQRTLAELIS